MRAIQRVNENMRKRESVQKFERNRGSESHERERERKKERETERQN